MKKKSSAFKQSSAFKSGGYVQCGTQYGKTSLTILHVSYFQNNDLVKISCLKTLWV